MEDPRIITPTNLAWSAFLVAGIILLFAASVLIGLALTALPPLWGGIIAFLLVVLVAALLAPELRTFWARLPR
jgi:hypothetical protein